MSLSSPHVKKYGGLKSASPGFSLIEVVIALAVVSVTFIGIIGLLGLGVASDQTANEQTVATMIASSIMSDLRGTPGNIPGTGGTYSILSKSTRFQVTMPTTDTTGSTPLGGVTPTVLYFDNSGGATTSTASPTFKASVYLVRTSHVGSDTGNVGQSQYTYLARVLVSWPAQTTTNPSGSVDIVSQFLIH